MNEKTENKVQKTVMVDAVLDKIIKEEMVKQDRSYSAILCQLIRKGKLAWLSGLKNP